MIPRRIDGLKHLAQDMHSAFQRLGQSPAKNLLVDTLDLDIHLNSSDTVLRARNLEVHIPKEVLQALDVGHHGNLAGFDVFDEAHGHAGHWLFDGHAGIHQCQGTATDAGLRGGTIGTHHF